MNSAEVPSVLFVFGCQRSGTTILQRIFEQDWNTKIYSEVGSDLSKKDTTLGLRLDPIVDIKAEIGRQKASLVIVKPLVESQNAAQLLHSFPNAQAIWMYRDYTDVAASKIKKSGPMSGVGDLRYIYNNTPNDWRNDNITPQIRDLVNRYFAEDMNGYDAAALYWYVRNQFYFQQNLSEHDKVMLCQYDDLVGDSQQTMAQIYAFLKRPYPSNNILIDIHSKSIGKGNFVTLSPEIEALCQAMLARLKAADQKNKQTLSGHHL